MGVTTVKARRRCYPNPPGFTLVELLIAIAISGMVLAAVCSVFVMQNKAYSVQEQVVEMQQNARAAMDMMTREIAMAGYRPPGATTTVGITAAAASSLSFKQDLNNDGDTSDANEDVTYSLYTEDSVQKIGRNTGGGNQPVAENIQSLTLTYFDANGNSTAVLANIRQVGITLTVCTAKPDPNYTSNGGYRTCTLTSVATPRNLAY